MYKCQGFLAFLFARSQASNSAFNPTGKHIHLIGKQLGYSNCLRDSP